MSKVKAIHNSTFKTIFLLTILILMALVVVGCSTKDGGTTPPATAPEEKPAASAPAKDKEVKPTKVNDTTIAQVECAECHEMWPEIATWQTSVHAKVPCLTCHVGYDPQQSKAAHDSGAFQKPIAIRKNPVSDAACRSCHSMENRLATLLPDIIAPHEKHEAGKVSCLECHRFATHGNIAERKVTTRKEYADYNQWTPQLAKQAAPQVMRRPNMFVCIKCHEQRKVTTACAACHYYPERMTLPSHENPQWGVIHGVDGRKDVNNCAKCHYDKESQKFATPSTGDLIADFARANSYCYGCHLKRPGNHDAAWKSKHPQMAKDRGLPNCFACHDRNQPGANVTGTYCNTCHWFQEPKAATAEKQQN